VSNGVNSLQVSNSVHSMCYVMDKGVDMVQCFQNGKADVNDKQ
jgi:hypothetical protein